MNVRIEKKIMAHAKRVLAQAERVDLARGALAAEEAALVKIAGSKTNARQIVAAAAETKPRRKRTKAKRSSTKAKVVKRTPVAAKTKAKRRGRRPNSEGPSYASIALKKMQAAPEGTQFSRTWLMDHAGLTGKVAQGVIDRFTREEKIVWVSRGVYKFPEVTAPAPNVVPEEGAESAAADG